MGLRSPTANGPSQVASPIPSGQTLAGLEQTSSVPQGSKIPPMSAQGGSGEPQRAPAGGPPDTGDYLSGSPGGGSQSQVAPNDTGDYLKPSGQQGNQKGGTASPQKIHEMIMDQVVETDPESYRKSKDGGYEQYDYKGKKWEPYKANQELTEIVGRSVARVKAKLQEGAASMIHPTGAQIGGMVGEAAGAATEIPGAAPFLAAMCSIAGGKLADWAKKASNIDDKEAKNDYIQMAVDAAQGLIGPVMGKLAGRQMAGAATDEAAAATIPGQQANAAQANQLAGDLKTVNGGPTPDLSLRKDQMNVGQLGPQKAVAEIQAGQGKGGVAAAQVLRDQQTQQNAAWVQKFDSMRQELRMPLENSKTYVDGLTGHEPTNIKNFFDTYLNNVDDMMRPLKDKVRAAAGNSHVASVDNSLGIARAEINKIAGAEGRSLFDDKTGRLQEVPTSDSPGLRALVNWYQSTWERNYPEASGHALMSESNPVMVRQAAPGTFSDPAHTAVPKYTPWDQMGNPGDAPIRTHRDQLTAAPLNPAARLLPPNPAGQAERGLPYGELEAMKKAAQDRANFNKQSDRTDAEKAWGKISFSLRKEVDDSSAAVLEKSGDKHGAAMLRSIKDMYSQHAEVINNFQDAVKNDPSNAAMSLIKKDDPVRARQLVSVLTDEQRKYLAGGLLDGISSPAIDSAPGRQSFNADQIYKAWQGYDPKVKEAVFKGYESKVDAMLRLGKRINDTDVSDMSPQESPEVRQFARLARDAASKNVFRASSLLDAMFKNKPQVADYILATTPEITVQDANSLQARARMRRAAANLIGSASAKAASGIGAGTIASQYLNQSPRTLDDFENNRAFQR